MEWKLGEPLTGVSLTVRQDGVWIRRESGGLEDLRGSIPVASATRLGRLLPTLIPQLIELGLGMPEESGLRISHHDFAALEEQGIDAFADVAPWVPYTLELEAQGELGWDSFRYRYRFYFGTRPVYPERLGCFVRQGEKIYRLDGQTFTLVEAIERFNSLPAEKKVGRDAYLSFAEIRGLAEGVGAQLDRFLTGQRVLVPSRVTLDLIPHEGDRISFIPRIDGAPPEAMLRTFIGNDTVDEVYSLGHEGGGGLYVVLDEQQRDVLRRMQRVRRIGGAEKVAVLRDPKSIFDGVGESVDLKEFGPRVRGIGDFPFTAQPYYQAGTGIFDDVGGSDAQEGRRFTAGLKCRYADGRSEDVQFASRAEIINFNREVRRSHQSGKGEVEFRGKSILVDQPLVKALDELVEQVVTSGRREKQEDQARRRYLLIYTNNDELEYAAPEEIEASKHYLELPTSLKERTVLKPHQRDGVAWLQRNYRLRRHGCLLADDMGVGKTLQVLTFLAWLIERGEIQGGSDPACAPWNPILIVAPVILLENETWVQDMRQFFKGDGAVFSPYLTLRGDDLKNMRRRGGQETLVGEPVLDLERLRQYRVILTNYETVVNYQHSFARMRDAWSVVITDEAQEYKTPNTKISHALKSLAPRFRVACTGTPVETRLLDVWNLFDFLQPGPLLGTASEFSAQYEKPGASDQTGEAGVALEKLKRRLCFNRPDAYVLRREKAALRGLPEKHEKRLDCFLSEDQRRLHLELINRARSGGGRKSSAQNHPAAPTPDTTPGPGPTVRAHGQRGGHLRLPEAGGRRQLAQKHSRGS